MGNLPCRYCGSVNPPDARFCAACGMPFAPDASPVVPPGSPAAEVRRLRYIISYLTSRIDNLEGTARTPAPGPDTAAQPAPAAQPAAVPPVLSPVPPAGEEAPDAYMAAEPRPPREWEQIFGGSWLARIGVLALIFGAAFFLKYAFDNGWINPQFRVIIGIAAGLFMLWLGRHWRNSYPILTRVLSGGGIAIMYLSVFAAFAFYAFLNFYVAVFFLFVISAATALLALSYRSQALGVLGMIGAFLAPFVLGHFGDYGPGSVSTGTGPAVQLLLYLLVIDIGIVFLSRFQNWRWLALLALVLTLISYGTWHGELSRSISDLTALLGIAGIFLIFGGLAYYHHAVRRAGVEGYDIALLVINGVACFGISLAILAGDHDAFTGLFALLFALVHGGFTAGVYRRNQQHASIGHVALGIGLAALTIAVPLQFHNTHTTTLLWALEAAALSFFSERLRLAMFRFAGFAVIVVLFWRLLLWESFVRVATFTPVLNARFGTFLAGIAAMAFTAFVIYRRRNEFREWWLPFGIVTVVANFLAVFLISAEVWSAFDAAAYRGSGTVGLWNAQALSLTAVWAIYAALGLAIGIWRRWRFVRIGALGLLAVAIIKVFTYDVFRLDVGYRIGAFVGLGILLLVSAYLYQRYNTVIKGAITGR